MVNESALALKNLWVAVRVENKYLRRYPKRNEESYMLSSR
jgi:hypothetical protein